MTEVRPGWSVDLVGHPFDLEDWEAALQSPFDPWTQRDGEGLLLGWSGFAELTTADQVRDSAEVLVEQLNGAFALANGTRRVTLGSGVICFGQDGSRSISVGITEGVEARSKVGAVAVKIGPDGKVI